MKPSIPENGRVIRLEGPNALIMLEGSKSCKGCGAAKIGLCRSGQTSMFLTAENKAGSQPGDQVIVGIDKKTRRLGYLFAYILPVTSFLTGAAMGSLVKNFIHVSFIDSAAAFASLAITSAWSFRHLRKLDRTRKMEVLKVVSDYEFNDSLISDEERMHMEHYK